MIHRELNVAVLPSGSLQLEWTDTEDTVSKSQKLLEEEVHSRFVSDTDGWLLFLCFSKEIKKYDGAVEGFIKIYSPDVHLVGRFFSPG